MHTLNSGKKVIFVNGNQIFEKEEVRLGHLGRLCVLLANALSHFGCSLPRPSSSTAFDLESHVLTCVVEAAVSDDAMYDLRIDGVSFKDLKLTTLSDLRAMSAEDRANASVWARGGAVGVPSAAPTKAWDEDDDDSLGARDSGRATDDFNQIARASSGAPPTKMALTAFGGGRLCGPPLPLLRQGPRPGSPSVAQRRRPPLHPPLPPWQPPARQLLPLPGCGELPASGPPHCCQHSRGGPSCRCCPSRRISVRPLQQCPRPVPCRSPCCCLALWRLGPLWRCTRRYGGGQRQQQCILCWRRRRQSGG